LRVILEEREVLSESLGPIRLGWLFRPPTCNRDGPQWSHSKVLSTTPSPYVRKLTVGKKLRRLRLCGSKKYWL